MSSELSVYLAHILQAGRKAQRIVADCTWEKYQRDESLAPAVERQLEIIGEAMRQLLRAHPEFEAHFPDAHRIIGMRDILIHGYARVDHRVVWDALHLALPGLLKVVERLLDDIDPEIKP